MTKSILNTYPEAKILWLVNKKHKLEVYSKIFEITIAGTYDHEFYNIRNVDIKDWIKDLSCTLEYCRANHVSKIIYHTSIGLDFKCLDLLIAQYQDIEFHLCTPYSSNYMPGLIKKDNTIIHLKSLQYYQNFYFWTETPELADFYNSKDIKADFLGIPTWDFQSQKKYRDLAARKYNNKLVISFFGPARNEKNFHEFARTIYALSQSADFEFYSKLNTVFVSIIKPKNGYSIEVQQSIKLLEEITSLDICLQANNLSRDDYFTHLSQSHLVWLAYDQKAYADGRGSGILVDCLAAGSCFIASIGTTPQYYLRGNGFVSDSAEDCARRIIDFADNTHTFQKSALRMQDYFWNNYSQSLLLDKLVLP